MPVPGRRAQTRDPFADVPAFDAALAAADNPPPPPTVDAPPAPDAPQDEDARVAAAKQRYLDSIEALSTASTDMQMHKQAVEIQRRRVVWMLMREAVSGESDPDVLKELHTLSKMIGGAKDDFDAGDDPETALKHDAAEALLRERGVDPEKAGKLLRVLTSMSGAGGTDEHDRIATAINPGGGSGTGPGGRGRAAH